MINEFERMRKLAGINEMRINKPDDIYRGDLYGEINAIQNELHGALQTGDYTEKEYLEDVIDASEDELKDMNEGYHDVAVVLYDLDDKDQKRAISNIKKWAKKQLVSINEMRINKPGSGLRIIKLIKGKWGLLVNNKYLFARFWDSSLEELRRYNLIDSRLNIYGGHEEVEEYLEVNIPEPSFGGGGSPEEIEEAYDEYEENCAISEEILTPYSFEHNYDTFLIDINKINHTDLI